MRILLLGHLGIGDHIVMNGLVHYLRKTIKDIEEICIMAPDDYRKQTLIHMYEEFPIITFHFMISPLENDYLFQEVHGQPQNKEVIYKNKIFHAINFGLHSCLRNSWLLSGKDWVESLYSYPLNLPDSIRLTEFLLPTNLSVALNKYENLITTLKTSQYIIVHDDPSRNRYMNQEIFGKIVKKDSMAELPILYLGKYRYSYMLLDGYKNPDIGALLEVDSLFDLYFILKYASACHIMDSSIACLIDCSNIQGKLYVHDYMMPNTGKQLKRVPWVRVSTLQL